MLKNGLLLILPIIAQIPSMYHGNKTRYNLGIFIERSTRIDYWFRYWGYVLTFLVLAYCLKYPDKIDERVKNFILIISILDVLHIGLLSMRGFGMAKVGIATILTFGYDYYKRNYDTA